MEMIFLDKKGQAAITDALYFLTIVASLCLFLFVFATQYGNTVSQSIKDRYLEEYESSALKTILYSSTPRDPTVTGLDSKELDFLLAAVKEDFADDQLIDETRIVLKKNIERVMSSKAASFDYIFYIYSSDTTSPFPFFLYYKSQWPEGTPVSGVVKGTNIDCENNPGECGHKFLFCNPGTLARIDALLLGVSGVPPAKNRIKLVKLEPVVVGGASSFNAKSFTAEAFLKMWSSTSISDNVFAQLNCCEAETPNCPPATAT